MRLLAATLSATRAPILVLSLLTQAIPSVCNSTTTGPKDFVTSGSVTYFSATDSAYSHALYRTDGTAAGTAKVTTAGLEYSFSKGMFLADGYLYLRSENQYPFQVDRMSRYTDTTNQTVETSPRAGSTSTMGEPYGTFFRPRFLRAGNYVYYGASGFANSSDPSGGQLFAVNVADGVTTRIRNLTLLSGSNGALHGEPIGDTLYFDGATSQGQGFALWKTKGTDATTTGICPLPAGTLSASWEMWRVPSTNLLVLGASHPQYGRELWCSDGTDAGTTMIKNINPTPPDGFSFDTETNGASMPHFLAEMAGYVYLTAYSSSSTYELWRTDGTTTGTTKVKSLLNTSWVPSGGVLNGKMYFPSGAPGLGMELFATDGTDAGTTLVKDINPSGDSYPQMFLQLNSTELLFKATGPNGNELWKTDGTAAGTVEVKDIYPGPNSSDIMDLYKLPNGLVIFRAVDGQARGLWRTDGTTAGTYRIADFIVPPVAAVTDWAMY